MSLGRESITSVVGGLLNFFNQGTVFFVFFFLILSKCFLLISLGFFLTPTKSVMDSAVVLKVIQSTMKPEMFQLL